MTFKIKSVHEAEITFIYSHRTNASRLIVVLSKQLCLKLFSHRLLSFRLESRYRGSLSNIYYDLVIVKTNEIKFLQTE